jgi:ABC-2 type transport system permease protein
MKKELRSYFVSPIAYIVITIFLIFTGFFFFKDFFYYNQAKMRSLFELLPMMFFIMIPAVTMRLFSEEKHSGSIEILLTLPVSTFEVVLGKFLAGTLFVALMISPTLVYLFTILMIGSPDPGPIIGGYIGTLFLGGAYTSIGILASSLSRNQIVAFITALAISFLFWLLDKIVIFLPSKLVFLQNLGTDYHFSNISRGIVDMRDVIYFLSIMAISILLTVKVLDERR